MKKMMGFMVLFAITKSAMAFDYNDIIGEQIWVQPVAGLDFGELEFKTATSNKGWSLSVASYKDDFLAFTSYKTKDGSSFIKDKSSEVSVMRFYRNHSRFFYADVGFGLGFTSGSKAENCVKQPDSGPFSLGATYFCNEKSTNGISVPLEANFIVGRYLGLGITLRTSLSKANPGVIVGISLPLGGFNSGN